MSEQTWTPEMLGRMLASIDDDKSCDDCPLTGECDMDVSVCETFQDHLVWLQKNNVPIPKEWANGQIAKAKGVQS